MSAALDIEGMTVTIPWQSLYLMDSAKAANMSDDTERAVASDGSVAVCLAVFVAGLCVPLMNQLFDSEPRYDVASAVRERDDARREVAELAFQIGVLRQFIHNSTLAEMERHRAE